MHSSYTRRRCAAASAWRPGPSSPPPGATAAASASTRATPTWNRSRPRCGPWGRSPTDSPSPRRVCRRAPDARSSPVEPATLLGGARLGLQLQDPGLVREELHPLGARCGVVRVLSELCLFLLGGRHGATDLGPPCGEGCLLLGDLRRLAEELRSPQ